MKRIFALSVFAFAAALSSCEDDDDAVPENPADMPYEVEIDPSDFVSSNIDGNDFFPLIGGRSIVYEGDDEGEAIRVVEEYTSETKIVMGVTCMVVRAREYENDELIEDTYDWYAEDTAGNVWYFGEDTKEIEDGETVGTEGSWEAGVDGALPGIIMLADPIIGLWYRQEYYQGQAEDVAQVLSLSATVTVPFGGTYSNCLQTAEWNVLEPGVVEYKYYATGVGLLKAEKVKGGTEYEELIDVD